MQKANNIEREIIYLNNTQSFLFCLFALLLKSTKVCVCVC